MLALLYKQQIYAPPQNAATGGPTRSPIEQPREYFLTHPLKILAIHELQMNYAYPHELEADLYEIDSDGSSSDDLELADLVSEPTPPAEALLDSSQQREPVAVDWQRQEQERNERDFALMSSLDPQAARTVFGNPVREQSSSLDLVVAIQALFRGQKGRRQYVERLYKRFLDEEASMQEKERRQMEEGLMVLDSLVLEQRLSDNAILRREESNQRNGSANVIQRAFIRFRSMQRKQSIANHWVAIGGGNVALSKDVIRPATPPAPPTT
jgi:hypothetical protein